MRSKRFIDSRAMPQGSLYNNFLGGFRDENKKQGSAPDPLCGVACYRLGAVNNGVPDFQR